MKMIIFILFNCFLFSQIFVSEVISFTPGSGQSAGQSEEYFPENIFGSPSESASENVAETRPEEICSIGLDGEIILSFSGNIIQNGDGVDFVIFENAFRYGDDRIYAEPAIVSVSYDGIEWYQFPYDSLSLEGLAGTIPTYSENGLTFPECGGNGFDLSNLNEEINEIKYIKIKDVTRIILSNQDHPFFDFTISGFDLDAVMGINYKIVSSVKEELVFSAVEIISDLNGQLLNSEPESGIYIIQSQKGVRKILKR